MGFPKWVGVFLLVLASAGPRGFQDPHEEIRRLLTAANYAAAESRARALVGTLEGARPESLELARALDLLVQALVEGGKPADPVALPSAPALSRWQRRSPDQTIQPSPTACRISDSCSVDRESSTSRVRVRAGAANSRKGARAESS